MILNKILSWFKPKHKSEWKDGYPPPHIPKSWITEGMRLDENNSYNVIPTWKYNENYYRNLGE